MKKLSLVSSLVAVGLLSMVFISGCSSAKVSEGQGIDETLYFRGGKCAEHVCTLKKDASSNLILTNEKGETGYGYLNGKTIHITGLNNREGTVSLFDGKVSAIYWYNGNNWLQK